MPNIKPCCLRLKCSKRSLTQINEIKKKSLYPIISIISIMLWSALWFLFLPTPQLHHGAQHLYRFQHQSHRGHHDQWNIQEISSCNFVCSYICVLYRSRGSYLQKKIKMTWSRYTFLKSTLLLALLFLSYGVLTPCWKSRFFAPSEMVWLTTSDWISLLESWCLRLTDSLLSTGTLNIGRESHPSWLW